jgi:hypothetical protein
LDLQDKNARAKLLGFPVFRKALSIIGWCVRIAVCIAESGQNTPGYASIRPLSDE